MNSPHQTTTPKNKLDILHHLGVINYNLDSLADSYEKLGFTLTPTSIPKIIMAPGTEPQSLGAGNRHAIFTNNYLELLGIVDAQRWEKIPKDKLGPYNMDAPLARYEGLHVMHLGTEHIEQVRERLLGIGINCSDIKHFQRNVPTANGEQTMKARSLYFPPELNPEGLLQVAQHDTPELVFQPGYMKHSNGATALTEIIVCAHNPIDYADKYARYTGHPVTEVDAGWYTLNLGLSTIIIVNQQQLDKLIPGCKVPVDPYMAAFTIETSSLSQTKSVLTKNGVPFTEKNGTIIVSAEYGGGATVIFKQEVNGN